MARPNRFDATFEHDESGPRGYGSGVANLGQVMLRRSDGAGDYWDGES